MCFEICCPLDYRPPVVVHHTSPSIIIEEECAVPRYSRFFNGFNSSSMAPLSRHRFGQYVGQRNCHQEKIFTGPVVAPGLQSRVKAPVSFTPQRPVVHATHVPTATVNGRVIPGYGKRN